MASQSCADLQEVTKVAKFVMYSIIFAYVYGVGRKNEKYYSQFMKMTMRLRR